MRELCLFAGAGGGVYASLILGHTPVGYVENDPYCQGVLEARQADGIFPPAPIWGDIREFLSSGAADCYRGAADVVSGGFPCQPHSLSGRRRGGADERDLWPETVETIRRVQPRFAFLENVPGLRSSAGPDGRAYFGRVLGDLAEAGYDAEWCELGADDLGAPHRRKRIWILAYAGRQRVDGLQSVGIKRSSEAPGAGARRAVVGDAIGAGLAGRTGERSAERAGGEPVAHTQSLGRRQGRLEFKGWEREPASFGGGDGGDGGDGAVRLSSSGRGSGVGEQRVPRAQSLPEWPPLRNDAAGWDAYLARWPSLEPALRRGADGMANRRQRIRAIGNGQVPCVAVAAWRLLMSRMEESA